MVTVSLVFVHSSKLFSLPAFLSGWLGLPTCFFDLMGYRTCSAAAQCLWLGFLVWQGWRIYSALGGASDLLLFPGGAPEQFLWPRWPAGWRPKSSSSINEAPQTDEATNLALHIMLQTLSRQ